MRELLKYLQEELSDCFNDQEKVPENYLLRVQCNLQEKTDALKKKLTRLKTDKKLMVLVLSPINAACSNECSKNTYCKLAYLDVIVAELEKLIAKNSSCPYGP